MESKKKKQIINFLVVLGVLFAVTSIFAFANYNENTTHYTMNSDKASCTLKSYDAGASGKVEIPATYEGFTVNTIEAKAFLKCKGVTDVVVPAGVKVIGEKALGFVENEEGEIVKKDGFVIWGRANSAAQKYAEENDIEFKVFLKKPVLVSVKNAVGGVTVNWRAVENAQNYNIYRKTKKEDWKKIATVKGEKAKTYLDKTAKNNVVYTYTVVAVYGSQASEYDKAGLTLKYIATPKVTLKNAKTGVTVSWSKNSAATNYKIYKKTGNAEKWTKIKTVKNNVFSYVDKTAVSGEKAYYCVIAAVNDLNSSYETNRVNIFLNEPAVSQAKNSYGGIKVYWSKVRGAQKYRIYRRINRGKWETVADVSKSASTFTDKKVTAGAHYIYTVKAVYGSYLSSHSKGAGAICVQAPQLSGVTAVKNGLKISWKKPKAAEYYTIYRKNANGTWSRIGKTKDNKTLSFVDTTVSSGDTRVYTVIAWYKNTNSSYNANGVSGTYISSPKLNSVRCFKSKKIVVEWTAMNNIKTYVVYKKELGGKYQIVAKLNSNVLSFTDTKLSVGKEYAYAIKAITNSGVLSGCSNVKTVRVLDLSKPMVALTYDDGPSSGPTTRILNMLEKYNSRATFFVVGSRIDSYEQQLKRAYKLKCEIANHTYNHKTLTSLSADGVRSELSSTDRKILAVTGQNPVLMRPPGGSYNNNTVRSNTAYPIIMWSV
ncbi:MAG: polysaccharide deacetylase family protein, partial [Clostridia bacterium]|nr:polysaccharide deacetylase family protein [Clostridia bacterium]